MSQPIPDDVRAYREARAAEYGVFVATSKIYHDGVLAYNEGHQVPVTNVRKYGYDKMGLVKRRDQPEAAKPAKPESK